MSARLRIATRKSQLALWQARHVASLLSALHPHLAVELVPIVTQGDRVLDQPLSRIGGKGLFLKELEQAQLEGRADVAVHSMKDMPAEQPSGLVVPVTLPRATPYDAWVCPAGATVAELPSGSRVGTSSLRRQSQLRALRPDVQVCDLRGNVDTRLRKLDAGQYDAIILACAGLERLGLRERITEVLQPPDWLPAAAQGIIALQCRDDDDLTLDLIRPLSDPDSECQALAERTVARLLGGSCQVPLAAHAVCSGAGLRLVAMIAHPDGSGLLRAEATGQSGQAEEIGRKVARHLLDSGAGRIVAELAQSAAQSS